MNKLAEKISTSLAELSENDRRALILLSAFFAVLFVYWIFTFSKSYQMESIEHLEDSRQIKNFVREAVYRINWYQKNPTNLKGLDQSLLAVASESAKELAISFKRVKPVGDTQLEANLENINFNKFLMWLHRLEGVHGILVDEISLEKVAEGHVNVRLKLSR